MNETKPKKLTHDALTLWHVSWTYSWRSVDRGVMLDAPRVSVSATMTLPKWTPPKDADPLLVERWQKYMTALLHHENGHVAIGTQAGREIEKQLAALPRQASVEALKEAVESTCQRIIAEAKAREKTFDEQTQHGIKQGARFP